MLYEDGGIVFDLGAAQDCLRATRETLHMFREDHTRSRSRSRDAATGSGNRRVMAATTFLTSLPEPYASPHSVPPPAIRFAGLWLLIRIAYWLASGSSDVTGLCTPVPSKVLISGNNLHPGPLLRLCLSSRLPHSAGTAIVTVRQTQGCQPL